MEDFVEAKTVLVVDDDSSVLAFMSSLLRQQGYEVAEACDGETALRIFEAAPDRIMLVITDIVMPEMDGVVLAHRLRSRKSSLPILLVSGFEGDARRDPPPGPSIRFLRKPFRIAELSETVTELANEQ